MIQLNQIRDEFFYVVYIENPLLFVCRHSVFLPPFIVKIIFSYLINTLYVCCVHVCVHMYVCVWLCYAYMHVWRPESHIRSLFSKIYHLVFWDRVFHRTWISPFGLDCLASELQAIYLCYLLAPGSQVCRQIWHLLHGFWGSDLKFLLLPINNFTHWNTSLAPLFI